MRPYLNNIVAFSAHLCIGVLAGSLICSKLASPHIASAISCALLGILFILICLQRNNKQLFICRLALTVLGFFCYVASELSGPIMQEELFGELKIWLESTLTDEFSEECSSILKALLCGDKTSLSKSVIQAFRESGASHILALSGMHLGIIYAILHLCLMPLGNSKVAEIARSTTIIACCWVYCLAMGAGPSLVRAWIFVSVNEICKLVPERKNNAATLCAGALCIQLIFNPQNINNIGFQLSYLAVIGIIVIYPHLRDLYPQRKGFKGIMYRIWEGAALSISCQISTAALVYHSFGTLPSHFMLTNILSLPLTSLLMISAVAYIALSSIGLCPEILKSLCETLAKALLSCMEIISSM